MKLNEDWEAFEGGPTEGRDTRIHVTLNRAGSFLINRNAHRLLGTPEFVMFYFNRKQNKIIVTATHRRNSKGFPVVPTGRSGDTTMRIQATPFLRKYDLHVDSTQKFVEAEIDDDAMLILDATNTVCVSHYRRRATRRKKD